MRNRSRRARMLQRGFTILEIVIVFILLAGIMAYVIPKIFDQGKKAEALQARIKMTNLGGQIEMYKLEVGKYPGSLQDLTKAPSGAEGKWNGPYVKDAAELKDAWGNEYRYTAPGQSKPFDLISMGADGKEGGEGENKDLSN
jgi:general secretion pathway protein G